MMNVIGTKRLVTLVVLFLINAVLGAAVYLYLVPEKARKQQEFNALRGQIATMQTDINRMQIEFDQLAFQQEKFEKLRQHGFFGAQGRRPAEIVLERIQKETGVVSAKVSIQPGSIEDNEEALKAEHKILVSPATIKIEATDDVDIYRYLYLVEKFFPGHIAIQKIQMERKAEVSGTVLRSIANGDSPPLVTASIEVLWRTMIPQKDIIGAETLEAPQ